MKITEITGLSTVKGWNRAAKPLLRATPMHYANSRGNKDQVIAIIPPLDFIKLSAPPEEIAQFVKGIESEKLSQYNKWAKSGQVNLMPFLRIDVQRGRVLGHEGRHRAGAVLKAGGEWMRVSLYLDPYSRHTKDRYTPRMPRDERNQSTNSEYLMSAADLPDLLYNQYDPSVSVPTQGWQIEEPDNLAQYRR